MILKSLELLDYRNYKTLQIDFSEGTNILYGNNAQGKTNILEAIYVCATTKSHRGSRDKELIRFEQDDAHIRMFVDKRGRRKLLCKGGGIFQKKRIDFLEKLYYI